MNWFCKHVGLILLAACLTGTLFAADSSVYIGDGDISALNLYDNQGNRLDPASEEASMIGEGWIIHNPGSPLLLLTPNLSVNLYEDSILVTGTITEKSAELYLVAGKATFSAAGGSLESLVVTTPVSRFDLADGGQMLVITTDDEESITAFSGNVQTFNALTGFSRTLRPFEKLNMQERNARPNPIEIGYYLTYATYPDMMLAQDLVQRLSDPVIAPIPPTPKATASLQKIVQEESVLSLPLTIPAPTLSVTNVTIVETDKPVEPSIEVFTGAQLPASTQVITVKVQPVSVPQKVKSITNLSRPLPASRITVTIRPMASQPEQAGEQPAAVEPVVPSKPSIKVLTAPIEAPVTSGEPVGLAAEESATIEPPAVQETLEPTEAGDTQLQETSATVPTLLSSSDSNKRQGFFGISAEYQFLFDGTNANTMTHRLTVRPYFDKGPFGLTLRTFVETSDFSTFTNNVFPAPATLLEQLSYGFSFIDQLRIGYSTSAFYLAIDHQRSLVSDMASFTAPQFGRSNRLVLQNKINVGPFNLISAFDDLSFSNLLEAAGRKQFASSFLQFTNPGSYPFSIAFGALASLENTASVWRTDLHPLLSFRFPIINNRLTQFSALLQAHGYLPVYPSVDWDQFVDTSLATIFPNYSLGVGFLLKHNSFTTKLLVSANQGVSHNLLVNDFAYAGLDTSYTSSFDLLADIRYEGTNFEGKLLINVPFDSSMGVSTLAIDNTRHADFSQLSLGFKTGDVSFGMGLSTYGFVDGIRTVLDGSSNVLSVVAGTYTASYLYVGYALKPFTFDVRAISPASSGKALVSLSMRVDLSKTI